MSFTTDWFLTPMKPRIRINVNVVWMIAMVSPVMVVAMVTGDG